MDEFSHEPFLLVANNDYKGVLTALSNATRIPVDSKGVNDYQDFTRIVNIAALNRQPKHFKMLNELGFTSSTIHKSTAYEMLYQNLMRTALRNPVSNAVVELITGSEYEADFLISCLGHAVLKRKIGAIHFQSCTPLTQKQRNDNHNANELKKEMQQLCEVDNQPLPLFDYYLSKYNNESNVNAALPTPGQLDGGFSLTLNNSIYDVDPDLFSIVYLKSFSYFVSLMRTLSKEMVSHKNGQALLNPITYKIDETGCLRKKTNFIQASMMILDFDGGNLSPKKFEEIFWTHAKKGQKRTFLLCNTFSRNEQNPNRFRVFFPYSQPAVTLEQHQAVYYSLVKRLEQNGFTEKDSKLDKTSINGTQPFYAPCTNRNYPEGYLFVARGFQKRDIKRYAINPDLYYRTQPKEIKKDIILTNGSSSNTSDPALVSKIESIKAKFRDVPEGVGQRNAAFYNAGVALRQHMALPDVRPHLSELAMGDKKMQSRVDGVMESLSKWKGN